MLENFIQFLLLGAVVQTVVEKPSTPPPEKPAVTVIVKDEEKSARFWLKVARDDARNGLRPSSFALQQVSENLAKSGLSFADIGTSEAEMLALFEGGGVRLASNKK